MIRVSGKDLLRPVELLRQHATNQEMRPSSTPERKQQISFLANLVGQTVRAADCEGKVAYTGIPPSADFLRQRAAGHVATAFIKRQEDGPIGYSRQNGLTLTLLTAACLPIVDFPQIDLPTESLAIIFVKIALDTTPHPADDDKANAHVAGPSVLRRVEIARFGQRFGPQLLDIVKIPNFRPEEMHDDVTGIDQNPIAILSAFDGNALNASRLQPLA